MMAVLSRKPRTRRFSNVLLGNEQRRRSDIFVATSHPASFLPLLLAGEGHGEEASFEIWNLELGASLELGA